MYNVTKFRFKTTVLCKNKYNVTGLCTKSNCPLANGYYATIIEDNEECYLYLKTPERANTPAKMWEKIKLDTNTVEAFKQIDRSMKNVYKEYLIQRCKRRLCRIREYLQKSRVLAEKERPVLVTESKKLAKRESSREIKALRAAKITTNLEQELVKRLKSGYYSEIYNFNKAQFDEVLDEANDQNDMLEDLEAEEFSEDEILEENIEIEDL